MCNGKLNSTQLIANVKVKVWILAIAWFPVEMNCTQFSAVHWIVDNHRQPLPTTSNEVTQCPQYNVQQETQLNSIKLLVQWSLSLCIGFKGRCFSREITYTEWVVLTWQFLVERNKFVLVKPLQCFSHPNNLKHQQHSINRLQSVTAASADNAETCRLFPNYVMIIIALTSWPVRFG